MHVNDTTHEIIDTYKTTSPGETIELGKRLAKQFDRGQCIALVGPLGAGKTVLVRGLAIGWGIEDARVVSSPTFVLVHEYSACKPIYHIDLYRLADAAVELADLGLAEMIADGVVVIEWADRAGNVLPKPRWQVGITITGQRSRRFELSRINP